MQASSSDGSLIPLAMPSSSSLSYDFKVEPNSVLTILSPTPDLRGTTVAVIVSSKSPERIKTKTMIKTKKITDLLDRLSTEKEDDLNKALLEFVFGCSTFYFSLSSLKVSKKSWPVYTKKKNH